MPLIREDGKENPPRRPLVDHPTAPPPASRSIAGRRAMARRSRGPDRHSLHFEDRHGVAGPAWGIGGWKRQHLLAPTAGLAEVRGVGTHPSGLARSSARR